MMNAINVIARRASGQLEAAQPATKTATTKLGVLVQVLSQQINSQAAGPFGMVIVQAANFLSGKLEATDVREQERWSQAIAAIAATLADSSVDLEHFRDRLEFVLDEAFKADDR